MLGIVIGPSKGRPFLVSALILVALGTGSIFLAVETGEAAGEVVSSNSAAKSLLRQHQDLAGTTAILFTLLTVVLAALLYVPKLVRRELGRQVNVALLVVYLLFYATGTLFLVDTAHRGARLVHEFGVRAPVASGVATTNPVPRLRRSRYVTVVSGEAESRCDTLTAVEK
jgi:uncharacterized membrane protein